MEYAHVQDSLESYLDAVMALRERHRAVVSAMLPILHKARIVQGLSKRTLAMCVGVSERTVLDWEARTNVPTPALFDRWRQVLLGY